MKFVTYQAGSTKGWGLVDGDRVVDLTSVSPDLKSFVAAGMPMPAALPKTRTVALDGITFLPPITDPDKVICIGLNYLSHVKEGGREPVAFPTIFMRYPNSHVGHMQPIIRPKVSERLDYEGELAVIIGRNCRHVARADAYSVVAGYSCYNDGSVRDWQRHSTQFGPGKNFYQSGSFGPWLVTPDEFGDPTKSILMTRLNGVEVQHAPVSDLIFDIPALIEYCSTFTVLEPGDVIVTGTAEGVGAYRTPPLWMKPGDIVEVELTGVGILRNPIEQEGSR
jgi:2-keto-4-pentenoate hydratase/2-oxohepta-3-ene-1,7-dioic acid hydratase in catechol pathway